MTTIELIHEYVTNVRNCASRMREHFGVQNLLTGWREGRIPVRGSISNCGLSFSFHGIGCEVETQDYLVDFDFGPNGEVGGFDAHRLTQFANSRKPLRGNPIEKDDVLVELRQIQEKGLITVSGVEPSPKLLYLSQSNGSGCVGDKPEESRECKFPTK